MSEATAIWLAAGGLVVTLLTAVGSKALREFSRHELVEICRRHKARSRMGEILRYHDRVGLGVETLQVLAAALLVACGGWAIYLRSLVAGSLDLPRFTVGVILGLMVLLAAKIWIPWAMVNLWAAGFLFHTWRLWRVVAQLTAPLVLLARFVNTMFHRLAGREPARPSEESIEEEIRTIVTEGHREGLLEEDAREMIEGVIELGDADVSEIMTPRTEMACMPLSYSLVDAVKFVIESAHSRIPVYDKTRDDIVGILYSKDLLPELAKSDAAQIRPLKALLRQPVFVPETKRVDDLLEDFQRNRNHMSVVLDEYGGVSGLVTIEDVLEEIVGEIVDEYDPELVDGIKKIDERTAEALGKIHVDEVNERLGLELPEDGDFDTIGGFVFTELGRIPKVGEQLLWQHMRFTILEATRRRIERLRIEVLDEERQTA